MADLTRASARTRIDVAEAVEIARMAGARDPNLISRDDLEGRLGVSPLVLDGLRRRPRYFDGRFLTGADLTRDQDYIRQRQADLARAAGTGVVAGLEVSGGSDPRGETLVINAGHGLTPNGDLVIVERRREIPILDLPEVRRLNATLGLRLEPRAPLGHRTGLFVLALRPVEYTANPIAAYPTTISGQRQIEDGDIVEATAVTLIPYPGGGVGTLDQARAEVAREIFVGEPRGLPQEVLPLAMVALDRGWLAWIDMGLVRRETGADTPLQVSLGARPRAVVEAHVLQYREHLAHVMARRRAAGLPAAFAAAQNFAALPPAGPLPAAAISPGTDGFRQLWFPPAVDVELSFAPADEVAALVEESLALPPIDFSAPADVLDATSVVVIAPVSRQRLSRFAASLGRLSITAVVEPTLSVRRPPALELATLLARRSLLLAASTSLIASPTSSGGLTEAEAAELRLWRAAWDEAIAAQPVEGAGAPMLWYVRRRSVPQQSAVAGVAVPIAGGDVAADNTLRERLGTLNLGDRFTTLTADATPAATARLTNLLANARITSSDVLVAAAVRDLEAVRTVPETPTEPQPPDRPVLVNRTGRERIDIRRTEFANLAAEGRPERLVEADVVDIASDFERAEIGDGLERIAEARGAAITGEDAVWLGNSGLALEVDHAGARLTGVELAEFTTRLDAAVRDRSEPDLNALIRTIR